MSSTVTSTSITVVWEEINCSDRNGRITSYDVIYGVLGEVMMMRSGISGRSFTTDEITPFTNYTFQVRGVNSVDSGPYSDLIIITTSEAGNLIELYTLCMYVCMYHCVSILSTPQLLVLCPTSWVDPHLLQSCSLGVLLYNEMESFQATQSPTELMGVILSLETLMTHTLLHSPSHHCFHRLQYLISQSEPPLVQVLDQK